jgi:hypothetical protein
LGRSRRRSLGIAALVACASALAATTGLPGFDAGSRAAAQAGEVTPRTDASVPGLEVTMIGATPQEAGAPGANETWGLGMDYGSTVLVRYTTSTGWVLGPGLQDAAGAPLSGFTLDASPLAGQMTPAGSGVLIGTLKSGAQIVLTRNPGQPFQETEPVPATDLEAGEHLFSKAGRAPLIAPLDEASSTAGAFVVPIPEGGGSERWVLHWDDEKKEWTREPIEIPAASAGEFRVLAIGASSPSNAWLLARLASPTGGVELFRRHLGTGSEVPSWQPVAPVGGTPGEALTVELAKSEPLFTVPGAEGPGTEDVDAQILTVTAAGVWIDGDRADVHSPTTMYFKAEPSPSITSWCGIDGAPAGTEPCNYELSEPLPTGPSRSIAWDDNSPSAPFGERVITGLEGGVSLRLEGTTFARVLALGGSAEPETDPGAAFGAAFSESREGWLGDDLLPVRLSLEPVGEQLRPWPVPFRHPLLAIAPQPDEPVGAISSEALAVGDRGEVARYLPGEGWQPESLLGPGGRVERPRLRAVAWPTPMRSYAVGDGGEMWLWRGETGLWEPDPATPPNFRGNLLGISFDPSNPAIGYAVGSGSVKGESVLLRYGKTWTQEPPGALPPQVAGASFTSVAFSGSEAIVAYRKLLDPSTESSYVGGLIVNNGSGWHVDQGAAEVMGSRIPGVVAGLPDGGAAFGAISTDESPEVFERESAGAPWRATTTPLPGFASPGALALFRENGALRAIVSGNQPEGFAAESQFAAPPGSPPNLIEPYAAGGSHGVLRQTAGGWSDEEHELNFVAEPAGNYKFYDTPYEPDPVTAVLIGQTGSEGWAVGGFVNDNELLETADVDRYPADGVTPPGEGTSTIATNPAEATFAIGGGAACAAPCADRAKAKIGPDVWLSAARARAEEIPGVRAFIYTGPRLANRRETEGEPPVYPYSEELERYAQLFSPGAKTSYTVAAPTDLDEGESETSFEAAFDPQWPASALERTCSAGSAGCHLAYAFSSQGSGGRVRVIVLDESKPVGSEQLGWLEGELAEADAAGEPAITVGSADIEAQIAGGGAAVGPASELSEVLVFGHRHGAKDEDGSSAYFYDAPEENVERQLMVRGESLPIFGSGTLGYVDVLDEQSSAFLGSSGFLLVSVDAAQRNSESNRAPVAVSLIPNIGELALEAKEGTLLRRSEVAQFAALARRPRSGSRAQNKSPVGRIETDPYIPIPSNCVGSACSERVETEFTFRSEQEGEIGEFVEPNLASAEPNAVELAHEEPIQDSHSGLFCAFNPGKTKVTISAGGLAASLEVTVQAGSVRRPCGTKPIKEPPAATAPASVPVPPALGPTPTPTPAGTAPTPVPVPSPPPLTPPPVRPGHPTQAPPTPFFIQPALPFVALAFVPPPLPAPAEPTPPSGTSAVTSPVEAAQKEEEEEEATESVSNQALAYRAPEHEPVPDYLLGIVALAAFAGASARRRPRRSRRELRVAPATISSMRSQRRASRR